MEPKRAASWAAGLTLFASIFGGGVLAAISGAENPYALGQVMGRLGCFGSFVVGFATWGVQALRVRSAKARGEDVQV